MSEVSFSGVNCKLKAHYQPASTATRPAALLLYTKPALDSAQVKRNHEKLIQCFYSALRKADITCVSHKFNQSDDDPDRYDTMDHLLDGAVSVNWMCNNNSQASHYLIFAYGPAAWVGMQLLMRRPEMDYFVLVSPLTEKISYNFLYPCPTAGLVLQGESDRSVRPEDSKSFVQNLVKQKEIGIEYVSILGADHFYAGKLSELSDNLVRRLLVKYPLRGTPEGK